MSSSQTVSEDGAESSNLVNNSGHSNGYIREKERLPCLLLHSAESEESLRQAIMLHHTYIGQHPESTSDLAYTLSVGRPHLSYRAFSIAKLDAISPNSITNPAPSLRSGVVMIFTGQGAQFPNMGAELLRHNEAFRTSFRKLDEILRRLPDPPSWSLEEEILKPQEESNLSSAVFSQPANTGLQIALVDMWAAFGVHPAAVVGHSSGEIAAAYAAKLLSAEEAITAAYYRGQMMEKVTMPGAMAGVGLSWKDTEPFLQPGAVLACENCTTGTTISGDLEAVQGTIRAIHEAHPSVMARQSKVDRAYHSPHMKTVGCSYHQLIKDRILSKQPNGEVQFFSSVFGKKMDHATEAAYWQMNLESPVRFYTAVTSIIEARKGENDVFLEIGPYGALAYPVRQTLAETGIHAPYIASLAWKQDAFETVLSAIGNLYINHVVINLKPLFPDSPQLLTRLPVL